MGGKHSQPDAYPTTDGSYNNGGGRNNGNNANGGHHHTYADDDHDNNNNEHNTPPCDCFLFGNQISKHLRQATGRVSAVTTTKDRMGTPLPDTPVFQRKLRQQTDQQKMIFSSQYLGLEKEIMSSSDGFGSMTDALHAQLQYETTLIPPPNAGKSTTNPIPQISEDLAQIYEGPDSENYLHEKYQLMEVLGVGSTSTVHRCVCRSTGKEYACKVIDCSLIDDRFQGMMSQFQVEIETLRQLQHPGIIRLYDVYIVTPDDKIFIVMELMEGGELFDYVVQKGTLTEEEASKIVQKVTSALVFMHSKNIVHRDLKPENLLLKHKPPSASSVSSSSSGKAPDLDVKIIDFGLSKAMKHEESLAQTFLGTRGYLAPEMLQRRDYNRAVDTWALGVIVFVLLCGCLPFDDDSSAVPSDDVVKAKFVLRFPRWAKNLSPSAKDLLSHLLDVNPRTRYSAEQALEHPWVRGVTARRDSLLQSPGRIKKSPLLISSIKQQARKAPGRKYIPSSTPDSNGSSTQTNAYSKVMISPSSIEGPKTITFVRQASL